MIQEIYSMKFIDNMITIFNENKLLIELKKYNIIYKLGIRKIAKRKKLTLYLYIKLIVVPLIEIKKFIKTRRKINE